MSNKNDLGVSISVITYNHSKFIRKCLDGILMQETNFPIEILIHDDASTDDTQEIINEYKAKFPEIIKPILRKKNLYSTGVKRIVLFNYERAKYRYIAECEGDDYWTDKSKLQKQVDFLEMNPNYSMCTHASNCVNSEGELLEIKVGISDVNCDISTQQILTYSFPFQTSSRVTRTAYMKIFPEYFYNAPIGDVPLHVYLSTIGNIYFIAERMSTYRKYVVGSSTVRNLGNETAANEYIDKYANMLSEINKFYGYKYQDAISHVILSRFRERKPEIARLLKKKYINEYKNASSTDKVFLNLYINRLLYPLYRIIFYLYHNLLKRRKKF